MRGVIPDAGGGAFGLLLLGGCSSLAEGGAASGCGINTWVGAERSSFVQLCSSLISVTNWRREMSAAGDAMSGYGLRRSAHGSRPSA